VKYRINPSNARKTSRSTRSRSAEGVRLAIVRS
jgi:hypothetical protein